MIWQAIGALVCLAAVHCSAWFQGHAAGVSDGYDRGYMDAKRHYERKAAKEEGA